MQITHLYVSVVFSRIQTVGIPYMNVSVCSNIASIDILQFLKQTHKGTDQLLKGQFLLLVKQLKFCLFMQNRLTWKNHLHIFCISHRIGHMKRKLAFYDVQCNAPPLSFHCKNSRHLSVNSLDPVLQGSRETS